MFPNLRHFAILVVAAGALASCATDRSLGLDPGVEVTALAELPRPQGVSAYLIGPQETLQIDVVGAPSLSGTFLTDVDSRIDFPLTGTLDIAGKTPTEAGRIIADALRGNYVRDPQVRVLPKEFPVPSISVGGQVKRPGNYPASGQPTLLRLVNQAEGLTDYARLDDVLIMRQVGGKRYIGVYNIGAVQRGNYPDPQLYPGDIVMVGDSPERRRLETLLQVLPTIITTAVILVTQT